MSPAETVVQYQAQVKRDFTGDDIRTSLELWSIAEDYVKSYTGNVGDSKFMNSLVGQRTRLTHNQAAVVLNIFLQSLTPPKPRPEYESTGPIEHVIPNGYYTVEEGDHYLTIRVRDYKGKPGEQKLGYLIGPVNTRDYINCASIRGSDLRLWNDFKDHTDVLRYFNILLTAAQDTTLEGMGKLYAMLSQNCYVCGKPLTTPWSKAMGMGEVCANKG